MQGQREKRKPPDELAAHQDAHNGEGVDEIYDEKNCERRNISEHRKPGAGQKNCERRHNEGFAWRRQGVSIKELIYLGKVVGDRICAELQSEAQQSSNEQAWIDERAKALWDCTAIASTLKNDPWSSRGIEDERSPGTTRTNKPIKP